MTPKVASCYHVDVAPVAAFTLLYSELSRVVKENIESKQRLIDAIKNTRKRLDVLRRVDA
jgi:hypothetical protein